MNRSRFDDQVTGALTVGARKIPLTYVYGFEVADDRENPPTIERRVLLADRAVPSEALRLASGCRLLHAAQGLVGVELTLPRVPGGALWSTAYLPAKGASDPADTLATDANYARLDGLREGDGRVAARVATSLAAKAPYGLDATFDAMVHPVPPVSRIVTGKALRSHPLVGLALRQVAAMRRGDLKAVDAVSTTATRASEAAVRKLVGETKYRNEMRDFAAGRIGLNAARFTRLVLRGDRATLRAQENEHITLTFCFVLEDGQWKMQAP